MNYLITSLALILLTACAPETEKQYATHPKALQQAMQQCPQKSPKHVSCTELGEIATRINQLAYQLQSNQQGYGKDILNLQETITTQRSQLEKHPEQGDLQHHLKQNERQLQERLAVVRWLASPEH
jgi:hypothetical protein